MHKCSTNGLTSFLDKNTRLSMYFRKGQEQDDKLLSVPKFDSDPDSISKVSDDPGVSVITDFNQNPNFENLN